MNEDLFNHDYSSFRKKPVERDHLFLWTVGILLLIGFAFACWLGSFYIFGHPEKPESYRILQKLHKIEAPKQFELTRAPAGEFLSPQKAYERYTALSRFDLERENEGLTRDYINNFQATKRLVPYITGRYTIMRAYELKPNDFFGSGVVVIAQSVDFPQTLVEHIYPASAQYVPILTSMLSPGLDIKLEKTTDLSAILRVTRLYDGRLQFTVVPLLYGSYAMKDGSGSFSLEPPSVLNPAGGLPIVRGQMLEDALKAYVDMMHKRMGGRASAGATPQAPAAQPASKMTIVRVDTPPPPPIPIRRAEAVNLPPGQSVAPDTSLDETAPPVSASSEPTPAPAIPAVTPKPATVVAASGSAAAVAVPQPTPTPVAVVSGSLKVPLVPFLVSSPTPGITASTVGAWRTYPPGRMPRGRLVSIGDAGTLAERGAGGERLYLRGNFVVTAVTESKAVLRPTSVVGGALANAFATMTHRSEARVIVEFPRGVLPPTEGATVSRDATRPFEVRDVRKSADGQINIFARDVTVP